MSKIIVSQTWNQSRNNNNENGDFVDKKRVFRVENQKWYHNGVRSITIPIFIGELASPDDTDQDTPGLHFYNNKITNWKIHEFA